MSMTAKAAANISGMNFLVASCFASTLLLSRKLTACKALSNALVDCEHVFWAGPCMSFVAVACTARVLDAIGETVSSASFTFGDG